MSRQTELGSKNLTRRDNLDLIISIHGLGLGNRTVEHSQMKGISRSLGNIILENGLRGLIKEEPGRCTFISDKIGRENEPKRAIYIQIRECFPFYKEGRTEEEADKRRKLIKETVEQIKDKLSKIFKEWEYHIVVSKSPSF